MSRIAGVVLSGCGVMDGSEITETVAVLIALDQRGVKYQCFAPNVPQATTMNHLTRVPMSPGRNVLEESARIARSKVRPLSEASASELDLLVFPGGYGAAKNLSTFAADGRHCKVNAEVQKIILDMHAAKKPIALACIAPVIAAKVLSKFSPTVTIGTDTGTASAIEAMGAKHQNAEPTGICVDHANRLVTTPCYMNDIGPWSVYQGVDAMIEAALQLV